MSTKNIYLFKVSIRDTQTNTEVPVQLFRGLFREISFMAFLIFYFLLSLKEMSVLVGTIHNDKGAKTDKEIKELKEKIQSKQNQ